MSQILEVRVPDIGDFKDVPVIEIMVAAGATVMVDEALVLLESDKATIDVPSPAGGLVKEVRIKIGDTVSRGSVLLLLELAEADVQATVVPKPPPVAEPRAATPAAAQAPETLASPAAAVPGTLPHASPSLRRFARELGVDLTQLDGSGPKRRILYEDVKNFVKTAVACKPAGGGSGDAGRSLGLIPWPQVDFAKFGPVERTPLSKIKKIAGASLLRNSVVIPHVTNFDEADVTALEEFRLRINKERQSKTEKLTMLAFMIKAAASALKSHPGFNASLVGDDLILKQYFNIGFAADTPGGLIVPVIKDADKKGLTEIAIEASEMAERGRSGKLKPGDMQGGCTTISSLGGIGGLGFTPIINAPEVAIIGAARAKMAPVWDGAAFQPRLMMPVSLSWDHRVIDGAEAARFLVTYTALLADFRRVTL